MSHPSFSPAGHGCLSPQARLGSEQSWDCWQLALGIWRTFQRGQVSEGSPCPGGEEHRGLVVPTPPDGEEESGLPRIPIVLFGSFMLAF